VNETITGNVYRYRQKGKRGWGKRELFGNVLAPGKYEGIVGPDGVKFGRDGRLYVTELELGTMEVLDAGTDGLPLYR
jgi:hypothetical protein